MRGKRWLLFALAPAVVLLVAAGCGGSSSKNNAGGGSTGSTSTSEMKHVTVALVSDVGHFNDKSFNQSQLEGLDKAKADLGITAVPLQSNGASDYLPNLT